MTTRNLAVVDGGKVKAELRDVGESGQRSLRRIEEASRPASRALLAVDGAAGQVRGSLEGLTGRLGPLGKALEEPIQGISALRRVGVSFTSSQREVIESLVRTGQTAEAQRVILDALEQQVGGAATAEASGLTGAANRLSDAWGNLLKAIGRTDAVSGTATGALNVLARATEGVLSVFDEQRQLVAELQRQVDTLTDQARGVAGTVLRPSRPNATRRARTPSARSPATAAVPGAASDTASSMASRCSATARSLGRHRTVVGSLGIVGGTSGWPVIRERSSQLCLQKGSRDPG